MTMFDEQPDGDPHGECAAEIHRLEGELSEARRQLAEASNQMPVGYQRLTNGKWEFCSAFVAVGFGDMPTDGSVRHVYAGPVPDAGKALSGATKPNDPEPAVPAVPAVVAAPGVQTGPLLGTPEYDEAVAAWICEDDKKTRGPKCCNMTVVERCAGCPHAAPVQAEAARPLRAFLDGGDAGREGWQWLQSQITEAMRSGWPHNGSKIERYQCGGDNHMAVLWEGLRPVASFTVLRDDMNRSKLLLWSAGVQAEAVQPTVAAPAIPQPIPKLSLLQERWLKDSIRNAYDTGYSDHRQERAYRGLEIERTTGRSYADIINMAEQREVRAAAPAPAGGLTKERIQKIAETLGQNVPGQCNFTQWGHGYRKDADGRYTIPIVHDNVFPFARAIEAELRATGTPAQERKLIRDLLRLTRELDTYRWKDHACPECCPEGGDLVKPDFRCTVHAARAYLVTPTGAAAGARQAAGEKCRTGG